MTAPETYVFNQQTQGNYPFSIGEWASKQTPIRAQTFTDPPAADPDGLKTSIASSASPVSYSGSALNGVIGTSTLTVARNPTVTVGGVTPGDAPANVTFVGLAIDGSAQTETVATNLAGGTTVGVKAFASYSTVSAPAGLGTGATLTFGIGNVMGLDSKLADFGVAAAAVLKEVEAGVVVTTGTYVLPATSGPFGTYLPATVPNGTNDYTVVYFVGA